MAKNPFPFGSLDYDSWNYDHPQDATQQADPVADAKLSLAKSDALEMNRDLPDASTRASVQALLPQFDSLEKKYAGGPHSLLRGATEGTADLAAPLALASFIPGIGQAAGLASMATAAPDFLRRTFAPEADESRPGAVESALTALPMALPAIKGLRSLASESRIARGVEDLGGLLGGRAQAYEGAAQPMRPWPQPQGVRPSSGPGSALEDLMNSPSFSKLQPRPISLSAAKRAMAPEELAYWENKARELASSPSEVNSFGTPISEGEQMFNRTMANQPRPQGAQTFADAVRAEAGRTKSPFERMNTTGEFAGDRSVRGIGGLEKEGPGGLSSLKGMKKIALPETPLDIPTSTPIDPMEKLAARSAERFGRRFRKE